jgi:LuxR family maltose regulon positive regulatory protein
VAGLQLAALAMRQHEDRSAFVQAITGSHRYLLDYVQEEILQRQPLPVQRFLLQTAVLCRMNTALCAALTQDTTSQAMLELLERNNLFVIHLDDGRQWYRLHDLFREVLLARLRTIEPELELLLHERAARWYAEQGELREAVDHSMAARDFPYAADLTERAAPRMWLSGEAHVVHRWVGALPLTILRHHTRLALDAWLRLLESGHATIYASFARVLAAVEETIARVVELLCEQQQLAALPDAEVAVLRRRISLLRALMVSRTFLTSGDAEGMRLLMQETEALAAQEELRWKMVALSIACWYTESLRREGALLIPMLLEAKKRALATGDHHTAIRVMRWLAFAYMRAAKFYLLHRECQQALALIERSGERSQVVGHLHFFLISPYYAWNRLQEASGRYRYDDPFSGAADGGAAPGRQARPDPNSCGAAACADGAGELYPRVSGRRRANASRASEPACLQARSGEQSARHVGCLCREGGGRFRAESAARWAGRAESSYASIPVITPACPHPYRAAYPA